MGAARVPTITVFFLSLNIPTFISSKKPHKNNGLRIMNNQIGIDSLDNEGYEIA
jgi:hypothetical protein